SSSGVSFADGHKVLNTSIKGGVQPNPAPTSADAAVNSSDNALPKGFTFDVSDDEPEESCTPKNTTFVCIAQGSDALENPSGVRTKIGLLSDGTRTEPDENSYLVLDHNPGGATQGYDYGRHFLIQGHENSGDLAFVTRINLDVSDPNHRITLLTP